MKKTFAILLLIFFCSCNEKIVFERKAFKLDKEVFYGFRSDVEKISRFKLFKEGINKAFELNPIEKSVFPYELRVYFSHAFGDKFFLQHFNEKDSMIAKLYMAQSENRNDSLFMRYKECVTTYGNYRYDNSFKIDGLHADSLLIEHEVDPNILDNMSLFYIQIKNKNSFKYIIAEPLNFEHKNKNFEWKIAEMILQLQTNLNFKFNSESIIDSALINPGRFY